MLAGKERGVKDDSKVFGPSHQTMELPPAERSEGQKWVGEGAFQGPNYPESDMQREQHFTSRIFRRTWLSH